jgi:hypothetical protein
MRLRGWRVEGPDGICFRVRSPIFSDKYYWRIGDVEYSFKPTGMTLYRNGEVIAEGSQLLPFEPDLWKTDKSYFQGTLFKWVYVVRNGRTHKVVIAIRGKDWFCGQFSTNSKHPNMISFALANYLPTFNT